MSVLVKVMCDANGAPTPHDGRWVTGWNAHTPCYRLAVRITDDRAKAKRFESAGAAHAQWTTVSNVVPVRPDGKPNRPLTALSIEIETEEGEIVP